MKQELTIAIPTKDRPDNVIRLLNSLQNQKNAAFLVLIADASEEKRDWCSLFPTLAIRTILVEKGNLPRQRRALIENCQTKYIGFLDDDTTLSDGFLAAMLTVLNTLPENVAGATGWVDDVPGRQSRIQNSFRRKLAGINTSKAGFLNKGGIAIPFVGKPANPVFLNHLQGPCMFYLMDLLKQYGHLPWLYELYDKGFGRGEDVALSTSISKKGYNFLLVSELSCYHHTSGGGSPFAKSGYKKGMADSLGRYLVASNSLKTWSLDAKIYFFRYVFITFILLNKAIFYDKEYRNGLWDGLKAISKLKK